MAAKLRRFGYPYVNVDSGWRGGWDEFGCPKAHPDRFPEGIRELADYVHGKGQRFGIYYVPGIDEDLLKGNPPIEGTDRRIADRAKLSSICQCLERRSRDRLLETRR